MNDKLTHLDFGFEIKSVQENGSFAGYASVFNVEDNQHDIILPGAFSDTIAERKGDIKLLWQHNVGEPIGYFTNIQEDEHGLFVEGLLLLDVARAKEAYALLKSGAVKGMSIGYNVVISEYDSKGVRYIKQVDLWEISLVTFPANEHAEVLHVKGAAPDNIRDFEHFLRDNGFSRKQAKSIACHGFGGDYEAELMGSIDRVIGVLR